MTFPVCIFRVLRTTAFTCTKLYRLETSAINFHRMAKCAGEQKHTTTYAHHKLYNGILFEITLQVACANVRTNTFSHATLKIHAISVSETRSRLPDSRGRHTKCNRRQRAAHCKAAARCQNYNFAWWHWRHSGICARFSVCAHASKQLHANCTEFVSAHNKNTHTITQCVGCLCIFHNPTAGGFGARRRSIQQLQMCMLQSFQRSFVCVSKGDTKFADAKFMELRRRAHLF